MNKIILSLLLISIAFIGIGAAAASDVDNFGSDRPEFGVNENVVSDLEGPSIIQAPSIISSDLEGPSIIQTPSIISSDRPEMNRPWMYESYPAVDLGGTPICIYLESSICGGLGPDFGPHFPGVNFDIHDHPVNPIGPKGPILQ
ncbi:hypothetical protein [Methanobrevibacter sp.]|uniref:hypothetical protein n=1 Tax=Methanobrevibacter sp. TaxID=66852 RepID=UPI00388F754B